jgi:cell division protein FtsI/penicillin-binding protein 2
VPVRTLALAALVCATAALALGCGSSKPSAKSTLETFAAAWSKGDDAAAAAVARPTAAALRDLRANRAGLDGASAKVRVVGVQEHGTTARGTLEVAWTVPAIGRLVSRTYADLRLVSGHWQVVWRPSVVNAALTTGTRRLGTVAELPRRGDVLDRDGRPLVTDRALVRIGLQREQVSGLDTTASAAAQALGLHAAGVLAMLRGAGPKQFVDLLDARPAQAARYTARLAGIAGATSVPGRAQLAPSRGFARAFLGTVGPATAEQVSKLGSTVTATSAVGQSGLEARDQKRLGGAPTRRIVVRDRGVPIRTLLQVAGHSGRDVRTTLDRDVQAAAERALGSSAAPRALVAIQPSTGDVLAVADRPVDGLDRALTGQYPPGSTFKVVTTDALLAAGFDAGSSVACPATIVVDGKTFKNFEGEASGATSFARDFAQSCNTAFVSLAPRLPADALPKAALAFGLGRSFASSAPVARSRVPAGRTQVERAAAMIGQERILATPLAMAGVAATVADGRWRAPRFESGDPHSAGEPLPAARLETLRSLMRGVVTSGTGSALASLPGEPIGKSGTAEFGGGDPPPTHAWFIAARGDLAVAVLVERGRSGAEVAAPIAARFLAAAPG